ncbi:MAG: DUF664 domain-containing protein [Actinomycetes bacterium]
MSSDSEVEFPRGSSDERGLFLRWLGFLRGAVIRKVEDLSGLQAGWRPDGAPVTEFTPGRELTVAAALAGYRVRAATTDDLVRTTSLTEPCLTEEGAELRWSLLRLIYETARYAGHADATRELLDGTTGECLRSLVVRRSECPPNVQGVP